MNFLKPFSEKNSLFGRGDNNSITSISKNSIPQNFDFRAIKLNVINFISLLGPIYSGGVQLHIWQLPKWEAEMFALLACLVGKVRLLGISHEMNFAEFFIVKRLFMKNATCILMENKPNEEVSYLGETRNNCLKFFI